MKHIFAIWLLGLIAVFGAEDFLAAKPHYGARPAGFGDLAPMLRQYCMACHDAKTAEGELNLEELLGKPETMLADGRVLDAIHNAIAAGDMPPRKAKQKPAPEERERMVAILKTAIDELSERMRDDPGIVVMPRLARHEYRNALRDLSGGIVRDAGQFLPNEGGAGEGFSNVGEAHGMNAAQFEKYIEAAKGALRHLRASPHAGLVWSAVPRDPVDEPSAARKEAVDDIIAWHVAQQQKWGEQHREELLRRLGFNHAAVYLEAAWHMKSGLSFSSINQAVCAHQSGSSFSSNAAVSPELKLTPLSLAPVVLEKWLAILSAEKPQEPFVNWARAWQAMPLDADPMEIRRRCIEIVSGKTGGQGGLLAKGDFAPPYEISFHEAKEEVLAAAKEGYWPFRIEIGDAKELFFVVSDAGDGNRGEYAVWRKGRFQFADGTAKPWQEVTKVFGANSGKEFPFGRHFKDGRSLPPDSIGVQPPGALKIAVPEGATLFELELALEEESVGKSSVQAVVLREKPKSQSYIPGRPVFGGKPAANPQAKAETQSRDLERALRRRNLAEANRTKIGLNAERNVFAGWTRTAIEHIGGPWPDQDADKPEPLSPYYMTVEESRRNATADDLAELRELEERLAAIAQAPHQEALARAKAEGIETAKEGVAPEGAEFDTVRASVAVAEREMEAKAGPLLKDFGSRAWRRPLSQDELDLLLGLYRDARAEGFSFDGAMKSPLMLVLASPHFLYKVDRASIPFEQSSPLDLKLKPLSSSALASRLSFFLWASIPDDELLALAAADKLRDPEVLRAQARRMLRDPKAGSLASDFAGQLWGFAGFENFTGPDEERFKEFSPALRQAMLNEVVYFLADLFQNDRPLSALLDADYTFANSTLAKHYGLPWEGNRTTRQSDQATGFVSWPDSLRVSLSGTERGGLATMGLFLTKTSLPLRTSPVQRGVWLMENLLGRHLPNPPADVPPLSEDDKNAQGLNIRQQLELHRANPSCASCHDKIDPLGIALENFDAIGRWRESERDGSPLANTASAHDGTELNGAAGLKAYLIIRQDEFFRHFNRKLLGYALGRAVLPGDKALLDKLNAGLPQNGHRLSMLVETIVTSPQFMKKQL